MSTPLGPAGDAGTPPAGRQALGEWRTVRNPPAPLKVGTALAYLLSEIAALAREGQGARAIAMRQSLDVVSDFVRYVPVDDTPSAARSEGS